MQKGELVLLLWGLLIHQIFCGEPIKIIQRPANILTDFYAYRHISILHFTVPENVASATFKFVVKEHKLSGLGSCSPRDVTIHLKYGSIPFVQPDGAKIGAKILKERRRHYSLEILSNGDENIAMIDAPPPGDWYAIAFRSWSDPDNGKITQQGIGVSCDTVLDADLSIEFADTLLAFMDTKKNISIHLSEKNDTAVLQFLIFEETERMFLDLKSSCGLECTVVAHITARQHLASVATNSSETKLLFSPYDKDLHYVTLRLLTGNETNIFLTLTESSSLLGNLSYVSLVRKSLPDFFLFDYEHLQDNKKEAAPMNLTSGILSIFKFEVGPIYDIGGTLSIGLKVAENQVKEKKILLAGCVSLGYISNITPGAGCIREEKTSPPDVVANETSPSFIHVPYPEPGIWYLSVKAFQVEEKCSCAGNCTTVACEKCDCIQEIDLRIESSISSSSCIEGLCNSRGRCIQYMSGGFVFSACHCFSGYRGFDCKDDTYVLEDGRILVRVLTLTLSNLVFLGTIYIAIHRGYYTESIAYTGVLIFSSLYHACEAGEEIHSFCIMRLSVLQFCDFFNALFSIWVTLVAMAGFGRRLTAFFQVFGAVILAVCAELDRTALWVFLLPAITGCGLVVISWGIKCRSMGNFQYPARPYRTLYLGLGLLLVILGLICYAFFQTRKNYYLVHSFWHMCVAVGVMLLLPKRKYMEWQ